MSLFFTSLLTIFLTVNHGQRILDFTADTYQYPIGVRYLGCDVDTSTDEIYCIGGLGGGTGDIYRYVGDGTGNETGWVQEETGIDSIVDTNYVFNAVIVNGVLYFVSGLGSALSSYDLDTGVVTANLLSVSAGSFAETTSVNGNIIYIACGLSSTVVVAYDTSSGTSTSFNSQSSHGLGTSQFYQDTLYLIGGRGTTTNKLEYTNVNTISWVTSSQADNVPDDLDYLTSVVTPEGYIYAIGGQAGSTGTRDEILLYRSDIDRVRIIDITFPIIVYGNECVLFQSQIWCMGGNAYEQTVYYSNDLTPGGKGKGPL